MPSREIRLVVLVALVAMPLLLWLWVPGAPALPPEPGLPGALSRVHARRAANRPREAASPPITTADGAGGREDASAEAAAGPRATRVEMPPMTIIGSVSGGPGEAVGSARRRAAREPRPDAGGATGEGPSVLADVVDPDGDGLVGAVNVNTATRTELMLLPGLGPRRADAVLALRERRPFAHARAIVRVRGIGPASYARWKEHLKVRGDTTLRRVPPRRPG